MEQLELQLESKEPEHFGEMESYKEPLQQIIKPYQQEQSRRQKKSDFLTKCVKLIEKNDFFQINELLKSKQANEILEDPDFSSCDSVFRKLRESTEKQIERYRLQLNDALIRTAEKAEIPVTMDFPRFSFLKGIGGAVNLAAGTTTVGSTTFKSIDPRKIVAAALKLKQSLYDSSFDPKLFIDSLFGCYQEILKKERLALGNPVPVHQLYIEYVWSLQSKTFFLNMDKGKFRGYSIDRFAVDIWRFFESGIPGTEEGYSIRLNPGRIKYLSLIDRDGETRQITHVLFNKNPRE